MTRRYSLERDLGELERMVARLPDYLLSEKFSLPLAAGFSPRSTLPQLSLGHLLLRRRRLHGLRDKLHPQQQARLDATRDRHSALQREWTVHYGKKLRLELPARLRQMAPFFRDCQDDPAACAAAYPPEALRRTLAQEIMLALDEFDYGGSDSLALVKATDHTLRQLIMAGDFIWAPGLASAYPREEFWWLYGRPA